MQPKINLNKGTAITVYRSFDSANAGAGHDMVGTISKNALFATLDDYSGVLKVRYGSGFTIGYVAENSDTTIVDAYSSTYSTGSGTSGYKFNVRKSSNLYQGLNKVGVLSPGDVIYTDGSSTAGSSNPNRLFIKAFVQGGKLYPLTDGWVDIGLYEGLNTTTTVQVNGNW